MQRKIYLRVLVFLTTIWVLSLIFIPPFSELAEQLMLLFLSTQAS